MTASSTGKKISRDDLERQLRSLQDTVTGEVRSKKQQLITAAAVALAVVVVVSYLVGRKAGRRKTTIVEIRRV